MDIDLHIGHFKTGTTSFQKALSAARPALLDAGYHYPIGDDSAPHQHGGVLVPPLWNGFDSDFDKRLATWMTTDCKRVILSAEGLSNASKTSAANLLERLAGFGRVQLIYTIRNWADYLPSRYQQNIKVGDSWTWDAFLKSCKTDFKTHADINYSLILDVYDTPYTDSITVLDYNRHTALFDLCKAMGLNTDVMTGAQDFNPSRDPVHIETARLLNAAYHAQHGRPTHSRYTSLHSRTRQAGKINFMKSAHNFLTQNPKADALKQALLSSQKTETVLSPHDISDWTRCVQNALMKIGSPLDISHWEAPLPKAFHTAPNLTWHGLTRDLQNALWDHIQDAVRAF